MSQAPNPDLLDLLCARSGLVAAVGAGGKKSTLVQLVRAHRGSVALTHTVHSRPAPQQLGLHEVLATGASLSERLEAAPLPRRVAYGAPSDKPDRLAGIAPATVADLHARFAFDATYVKADGARMRWLKAPRIGEPVLPPGCDTVLALTSAQVIGRPLGDAVVHRVAHVADVTGAQPGELLTPDHLARLYLSADGLLRDVGAATVVPIMNMVDDDHLRALARRVAEQVLDRGAGQYDRFVLARMNDPDQPVVETLWRS